MLFWGRLLPSFSGTYSAMGDSMYYSFAEIERLARLLTAEGQGAEFDPIDTIRTAIRLAELCPDIAQTVDQVVQRMVSDYGATPQCRERELIPS
jgi:hypothetical protein